ncbi:jg2410 [Pararge aegeria aegeria]|uniref:Jg2410 protein n=1 Tax=Pararge aegeria aegeria TaxID=348720 RepID=A0A8S4QWZ9_9NEOP|nr:jg2410 [Pararge aegeria aegeria]
MQAEAVQECVTAHMAKNKEQVIAKRNQAAEEITFKVGETVYKQVAKTARNDKTKPVFKGPYKIIHFHPNSVAEIIGNHPNSKSIRVHFKLLRRPHLVPGQSSSEPSCSRQDPK